MNPQLVKVAAGMLSDLAAGVGAAYKPLPSNYLHTRVAPGPNGIIDYGKKFMSETLPDGTHTYTRMQDTLDNDKFLGNATRLTASLVPGVGGLVGGSMYGSAAAHNFSRGEIGDGIWNTVGAALGPGMRAVGHSPSLMRMTGMGATALKATPSLGVTARGLSKAFTSGVAPIGGHIKDFAKNLGTGNLLGANSSIVGASGGVVNALNNTIGQIPQALFNTVGAGAKYGLGRINPKAGRNVGHWVSNPFARTVGIRSVPGLRNAISYAPWAGPVIGGGAAGDVSLGMNPLNIGLTGSALGMNPYDSSDEQQDPRNP
jgi:hypothetical protein